MMRPLSMRKTVIRTSICFILCAAALGAGCWRERSVENTEQSIQKSDTASGPRLLSVEGRSSKDITAAIKLVASSILVMRENVTAVDPGLVAETALGMGENKRTIVIRRFAPGNLAHVDWKLDYKKQSNGKLQDIQIVGNIVDSHLLDSYRAYLPALWPEGEGSGEVGSGLIWLSQDVYENLSKGGMSTFYFGLGDEELLRGLKLKPGSKLAAAALRLKREGERVIEADHKDVYLAKTQPQVFEKQLTINGSIVKVEAMKITSWFGEITVLKNPYYPLILEVKTSQNVRKEFGSLFDYEIFELKDVQE